MRVRVNFRVNTETGEVEEFVIEDVGTEREPEHEAIHDRIATDVGKVVERRPAPEQIVPGEAPPLMYQPTDSLPAIPEQEKARE